MAAAVTRRANALRIDTPDGYAVADVESGRGACAAADSPPAKRTKDDVWVAADEGEMPGNVSGDCARPLLFRTMKVKASILHPYRFLILVRLIAVVAFFGWRVKHRNHDGVWLWTTSMVADTWFALSWILNQLPKLNPIKRVPDMAALAHLYGSSGDANLPGIDVFVTTVDPVDEPILYTVNTILSILATDYPVDRYACYLSDDGGTLVHYEAMVEVASFAELWVPFCRKHCVEPRSPENYFGMKTQPCVGGNAGEFMRDHRRVRREYEEFKVRIDSLSSTIRKRSDAYNKGDGLRATWMADGTQWPGTWIEQADNHRRGQHAGIVQVILTHPSCKTQLGSPASTGNPFDFSNVDTRLPMLVYISREKRPGYNHQKKAGAMNAMLRVSALLSNAPFIINFDCDHYINNSQAFRVPMCFMLDPRDGQNTAFVQFPQRFDDVDPTDRYANHNRVFFDGTMLCLNGIQGPSYLGTGTMFRRVALYGMEPPRYRAENIKLLGKAGNKFGNSIPLVNSMPDAAVQERSITPVLVDEQLSNDLATLMTCAYDERSSWGRDVGWVYDIATEDVATGFRMHRQGWRSTYCSMEPAAFRGTAPINLTERLYQLLRWSGGSLEMFFSHSNALLAGRRMHPLQRVAYLNMSTYPIVTVFILAYNLFPVLWLFSDQLYIQRPFGTYIMYLVAVIAMVHVIGMFEVKWAGITVLDWFRNEQFYMIAATGVYPTAVLYLALKLVTGKGIYFRLTSKQTEACSNDKFADLYTVRWVPLLIPTVAVLVVNVAAVGAAIGKAATWGFFTEQAQHVVLGMMFNMCILVLLYPFALGIMGQWGKRPVILFVILVMATGAVGVLHFTLHAQYPAEVAAFAGEASLTGSSG
ncbi:hypothetical protein QYE76_014444 [Lolium multiflorum]|uniref:Uncharacterized protein n=1 Tax=Lolium multiflorum TaxID=4521 RepID=A0AAD8U310_LOLMU|nr:hypothetical protein QYE76_014444 [Lolium multiflorum]